MFVSYSASYNWLLLARLRHILRLQTYACANVWQRCWYILPMRVVKSNFSRVGPSSERNMVVSTWLFLHGCFNMVVSTRLFQHGCFNMVVSTRLFLHGCFNMVVSTWLFQHGYFNMVVSTWLFQHGCFNMVVSTWLFLHLHGNLFKCQILNKVKLLLSYLGKTSKRNYIYIK